MDDPNDESAFLLGSSPVLRYSVPNSGNATTIPLVLPAALPDNSRIVYISAKCFVNSMDDMAGQVIFDFCIVAEWLDSPGDGTAPSNKYTICDKGDFKWSPDICFYNLSDQTSTEETYYLNKFTGSGCAVFNWILTSPQVFELQRFPYDRQILTINFSVLNAFEVKAYTTERGRPDTVAELVSQIMIRGKMKMPSWELNQISVLVECGSDPSECDNDLTVTIRTERSSFFYLINFGCVVFLIVLFALSVIAIDPDDFGGRTGITLTLLLTLIAFKFVMTTYVPPTSYLTLLDYYMLSAIIIIALVILENFLIVIGSCTGFFCKNWEALEKQVNEDTNCALAGIVKQKIKPSSLPLTPWVGDKKTSLKKERESSKNEGGIKVPTDSIIEN